MEEAGEGRPLTSSLEAGWAGPETHAPFTGGLEKGGRSLQGARGALLLLLLVHLVRPTVTSPAVLTSPHSRHNYKRNGSCYIHDLTSQSNINELDFMYISIYHRAKCRAVWTVDTSVPVYE